MYSAWLVREGIASAEVARDLAQPEVITPKAEAMSPAASLTSSATSAASPVAADASAAASSSAAAPVAAAAPTAASSADARPPEVITPTAGEGQPSVEELQSRLDAWNVEVTLRTLRLAELHALTKSLNGPVLPSYVEERRRNFKVISDLDHSSSLMA